MTAIGSYRASLRNQAKTIHDSNEILRPEYCQCQSFFPCLCQWGLCPRVVCSMERGSKLDGSRHFLPLVRKLSLPKPKRRKDFQGEVKGKLNEISNKPGSGISHLKVGGTSSAKSALDIPCAIRRKIVVSFTTSFRGHGEKTEREMRKKM